MKGIVLFLIRIYQQYFSFDHGFFYYLFGQPACRFNPHCSDYAYQAVNKYGIIFGSWKSFKRIIKCGPWTKGGNDPLI
ncbi:MAG: membrane protein insertion efficiency factor YidD [Patescibacteria group bacterium]|nr:membrane protein insertion efficiency factor YidD [Patescibacteria group bacterium]